MNPANLKAFDKILARMERRANRSTRRFTASPVVLTLGLILADVLLTRLVPLMWDAMLPGGVEQAFQFRGWAGLLWSVVLVCRKSQREIRIGIGVIAFLALVLSYRFRSIRVLVWLSAAGVIALNAAILVLTLRTSMAASPLNQGLGLD